MHFTKGFLLLQILLVFLIPQFDTLQDTLAISKPIRDGDHLVSNRETFALAGFFSPGESTNRYVGIWFYEAPERPMVWVANRDNPITDKSGVLSIDLHGNLVLCSEDQKQPIWSTNIVTNSNNNINLAQLTDSGNLVLFLNETSEVLWQSFDNPTDTFLPSMKLGLDRTIGLNRILTSWNSRDDPGIGNFSFILNTNSSSPALFLYKGNILWWRSGHWNGIGWSEIPILSSNDLVMNFNLFNNDYETFTVWGLRYPGASLFSRLVVNRSGSIYCFTSAISNQEREILGTLPLDWCDNYGKCGAFGKCQVQNDIEFECTCLPGFEPRSPSEWSARNATSKCVKKHGRTSICKSGEEVVKVENVKFPDVSFPQVDENLSLREYEQHCLENCSWRVYGGVDAKEEVGCMRWYGELMDTRVSDRGQNLYVRDALEFDHFKGFFANKRRQAIMAMALVVNLLLIFLCAHCLIKKKRKDETSLYFGEKSKLQPVFPSKERWMFFCAKISLSQKFLKSPYFEQPLDSRNFNKQMAQGRAILFPIIVLLCLGFCCESTLAKTFLVGGSKGWTDNISNWPPKGTTFHAGDILVFIYDPRDHNVVVVDKLGYETCKAPTDASQKTSGNDQVFLEKGANYFICTKRGHCEKNMKIAIYAA